MTGAWPEHRGHRPDSYRAQRAADLEARLAAQRRARRKVLLRRLALYGAILLAALALAAIVAGLVG